MNSPLVIMPTCSKPCSLGKPFTFTGDGGTLFVGIYVYSVHVHTQLVLEKIKSIGHRRGRVKIRYLFSMLLFVWFFSGG